MSEKFIKNYLSNWQLYVFLIPALVYIVIFAYVPMAGVQLAFKDWDFRAGIWGSEWIGFENFERFFDSYQFGSILWNTISLSLYSLVISFTLPIIFALLLNAFIGTRYRKLIQTVSYMPHFISTVVIVGMLLQIFNPRTGAIGNLFLALTDKVIPDVFANPDAFQHLYVWSGIWQSLGWSSIIYIAALAGVDQELHEAAQIDGATRFKRVLHIDFPSLLPTATILLILAVGNVMDIGFEKTYLMQNNLNISQSEVISTYVYKVGLTIGAGDFPFATAIGLFNSIINFILLILVNYSAKKINNNSLW
ncbi:sugar ABC transporter permease [Paenibacillus sp. MY03]|jgi:putative aldouronate transport system permease protein|uniref:ABC transporter permease n=1 Tax=Paenibacillus sp. MY03 TaxID=302980 RepID=UPI000B3D2917|nr:ABC transporter permease subunit [Paenibacillus sp. MY03]OUS76176.1 sugar ABC transporter permease [Paenibacillus sp. MY03]